MKKKLLFVLVVIMPFILSGQTIKPGIIVGINLANWREDDVLFAEDLAYGMNLVLGSSDFKINCDSRIGFSAGMLIDYQLAKFLSIQPELSYSQKGSKFSGTGTVEFEGKFYSVDEDWIMQLDYIDFSIMTKISLTKSNIKPYIIAGPGLGYLLSSKMKVKATVEGETSTDSSEADMFRDLDYYINAGVGFDFYGSIRIEFRCYHFFNPVTDESKSEYKLYNCIKSMNLIICF
ncbi:MAG: porin family protein [Bacteroidales bacterium]